MNLINKIHTTDPTLKREHPFEFGILTGYFFLAGPRELR